MHFVLAYDIEKDRRRNKVMNALKDVGLRAQYSVFECELTFQQARELLDRLRGFIDLRRDKVDLYPLCEACFFRAESIGARSVKAKAGRSDIP